MKKKVAFCVSIVFMFLFFSCALKKMEAFSNCEFKLERVNSLTIAGVKINPNGQTNMSLVDVLKISNGLSNKSLPLAINLDLNGKNPNAIEARMMRFDWKISIEGEDVVSGQVDNEVRIAPSSATDFNFNTSFDVYNTVSKYSMDDLKKIVNNVFDENGNPKSVKMFIKPYLSLGKINIPYPGFIELTKYYKKD